MFLLNLLKIIFLLGFLIFIHEGGHFLIAKLFKVKVLEFAIGFGPTIWSKQGKETKYALRLVPLGGFVNMLGEEKQSDDKRAYNNASIPKRVLILLAGGLVNIMFGIIIFFILVASSKVYISTTINRVLPNYAAENAGIVAGDKLLKINGEKIRIRSDIDKFLRFYDNKELTLTIEREGEQKEIKLYPTKIVQNSQEVYLIGLEFKPAETTFSNRLYYGYWETAGFLTSTLQGFKDLFTGKVSVKQLAGPVGISEIVVSTKGIAQYIYILAVISLSLGMTNLLPFPPLDGGKIFLLLIEAIRKKPLKEQTEAVIQAMGMFLLLALTIFVTYQDITRTF